MNSASRRPYHSPVREAKAQATRESILRSVADWLESGSQEPFTLEAIAHKAGMEPRTVYRHFQSRVLLLEAFWEWINDRITPQRYPETLSELIEAPRETFSRFDEQEGLIRASLHSAAGREMRSKAIPARREALKRLFQSLSSTNDPLTSAKAASLEALAHLLYSAAAWETLRDYAGLTGKEAGEAASWALAALAVHALDDQHQSGPQTHPHNSPMPSPITITRPDHSPSLWVLRDRVKFLGSLPGTSLSLVEIEVPPGSGTPPHSHPSPEVFRVLTGELTFGLFGEEGPSEEAVGPGGSVTVPGGALHSYQNKSGQPASALVALERDMIAFFQDLGRQDQPPAGPPTEEELQEVLAACSRHGITIAGGPPPA